MKLLASQQLEAIVRRMQEQYAPPPPAPEPEPAPIVEEKAALPTVIKCEPCAPSMWRFDIERDDKGYMTTILATPIPL